MLGIEKQNLIRKRILEGCTIDQIVREVKCSKNTVIKYKKQIPANVLAEQSTGDDDETIFDSSSLYTYYEKKYIQFTKDFWMYEDGEEGWTYHLDKENALLKTSGLWWVGIAYPESVTKNWIEKLEQTGLAIKISPLHDKDVWDHDSPACVDKKTGQYFPRGARYKAGDKKKAHWHIIIICSSSTSFKEINALIRSITNGPYLQKCRSTVHMDKYIFHETDECIRKGKYRYDRDEAIVLNDFHTIPNKYEVGVLQCEITNTVFEKGFTKYYQVAEYYRNIPEVMMILWAKPTFLSSLLKSQYQRYHPESKVQLTREIPEEEYAELMKKREEIRNNRKGDR